MHGTSEAQELAQRALTATISCSSKAAEAAVSFFRCVLAYAEVNLSRSTSDKRDESK
jgi:hypothetical protein